MTDKYTHEEIITEELKGYCNIDPNEKLSLGEIINICINHHPQRQHLQVILGEKYTPHMAEIICQQREELEKLRAENSRRTREIEKKHNIGE